jgi:hypothetical protein
VVKMSQICSESHRTRYDQCFLVGPKIIKDEKRNRFTFP